MSKATEHFTKSAVSRGYQREKRPGLSRFSHQRDTPAVRTRCWKFTTKQAFPLHGGGFFKVCGLRKLFSLQKASPGDIVAAMIYR
jgi:hypothetical protein